MMLPQGYEQHRYVGDQWTDQWAAQIAAQNAAAQKAAAGNVFQTPPKTVVIRLNNAAAAPPPVAMLSTPMSTGEKIAIGVGALGVVGLVVWAIHKK